MIPFQRQTLITPRQPIIIIIINNNKTDEIVMQDMDFTQLYSNIMDRSIDYYQLDPLRHPLAPCIARIWIFPTANT
ncbi:hypothetical protein Pmani_032968 [Petrolisthes manimaculis]|uniref:Uncharacterized protein n=1 Tax=Petrolisthes manimaculis TaxID=1843537 RepID=A0AAE1TT85_9EUCA|nr:hypothetical protein Pmani_032968 [Petrolisthes manimaculis]